MRYYSDKLQKLFNSEKECQEAEFKAKEQENREKIRRERELADKKAKEEKLAAERKARAQEVEEARQAMVTARSKYAELLEAFTKDYSTYHLSLNGEDAKRAIPTLFDLFNFF